MLNPGLGAFSRRFGLALFCAGLVMATMCQASGSPFPTTDPVSTNTCVGKWQDSDASDVCNPIGTPVGGSDGYCRVTAICTANDGSTHVKWGAWLPDDFAALEFCSNNTLATSC